MFSGEMNHSTPARAHARGSAKSLATPSCGVSLSRNVSNDGGFFSSASIARRTLQHASTRRDLGVALISIVRVAEMPAVRWCACDARRGAEERRRVARRLLQAPLYIYDDEAPAPWPSSHQTNACSRLRKLRE